MPWRGSRSVRVRPLGLPGGVDLDAGLAVDAAQQRVVGVLDPGLADVVAGLEGLEARVLELLLVDLADVAEQVGGEVALRILAHVDALDRDAREVGSWFSRR